MARIMLFMCKLLWGCGVCKRGNFQATTPHGLHGFFRPMRCSMDRAALPLFSANALAILNCMPFDSAARGSFEIMSGGLIWPDEFPPLGSPEWKLISPNWVYRYLIAYRRALTLGEQRAEFCEVWEQVVR